MKRRFEYHLKSEDFVFIDDYAHHPSEIEVFIKSLRFLYPNKKVTIVFQPHLFSRTQDFMQGFGESLSLADQVLLLDIYPARELPIEGVSSAILLELIECDYKKLVSKESVLKELLKLDVELLATVGAGDIDQLIPSLKMNLKSLSNTVL